MFKAWLRDLPDEIFPKMLQHQISASVGNLSEHQGAPEMLKEELSKLPPFNYYLLFAVTAHITMLLNASKENKMSFHNLCVCFMPALKMELPCFSWLILDWKNCWEGCATEKQYMEREYALLEGRDPEYYSGDKRPVQHYDRYNSPHPSQEGMSRPPPESSDPSRPRTNQSNGSHSGTTSPRPHAFSREGSSENSKTPDGKRRPAPLPTNSDGSIRNRRGSDPESERPQWKQEAERPPQTALPIRSPTEAEVFGTPVAADRGIVEAPELSPVKPLSPWGSLGGIGGP